MIFVQLGVAQDLWLVSGSSFATRQDRDSDISEVSGETRRQGSSYIHNYEFHKTCVKQTYPNKSNPLIYPHNLTFGHYIGGYACIVLHDVVG